MAGNKIIIDFIVNPFYQLQRIIDNSFRKFSTGKRYFLPKKARGSKRDDERDLLNEARQAGYQVVDDKAALAAVSGSHVLGLFDKGSLDGYGDEPSLAEMTRKAIELLAKDPDGFFLMVEGSQIDWACHGNDSDHFFREMRSFDAAVAVAREYISSGEKNALLIVTADHETGGMSIENERPLELGWSTMKHTATDVPLFASGVGEEAFSGKRDNTEVPKIIARLLKVELE